MKLPPLRALAAALALASVVAGCSSGGIPVGTALGPEDGPGAPDLGFSTTGTQVGEPLYYALWHPAPRGTSPVHFKSITAVGLPQAFVVDSIVALWGRPGGVFKGWDAGIGSIPGTPISQLILDPRCPPSSHCGPYEAPPVGARVQNWVILIRAHITTPGTYASKGLRVIYEVDGKTYEQTFPRLTIAAYSGSGPP